MKAIEGPRPRPSFFVAMSVLDPVVAAVVFAVAGVAAVISGRALFTRLATAGEETGDE